MPDTEKFRAAVFARTLDGRTLYAREATIEVTGENTLEVTAPDSQDATAARPIDLLRGVLHSARWAVDLTKQGQAEEANEHVDAIERLIAAYRAAAATKEA